MSGNRLVEAVRRVRHLLESRATSFWVIGAWAALTLVWLLPFQLAGQPKETVRAIAEDWFAFRAIYALVGLTTLLCAWTRISRDLRRIRNSDRAHPLPTAEAERLAGYDLDGAAAWLSARGYVVSRVDGSIHGVRHRYSLLGGSMFHFGLVLFGVALVAHLLTVETTTLRVTEGQSVADAAASEDATTVPPAFRYLTLKSIRPQYHEDVLLFTRLEAHLTAADGSARQLSLSEPYWAGPTSVVSISDYNLAPHIKAVGPDGTENEYVVAMNLSPPGTEDTIEVPDLPFEMSVIAYPDYGVVDGRDVSLSYNIVEPAFMLAFKDPGRTGSLVARELVGIDEPVVAEGYSVSITGLSRYGTFRMTSAPALPFIGLSFVMMTLGLAWRYGLRRHSVIMWAIDDGVLVDGWLDIGGRAAGREMVIERMQRTGRGR